MWLALLLLHYLFANKLLVRGHIPAYVTTPANRIDQYCSLAETCIHDTIPICGKNGEQVKVFLDVCDLLEYACDSAGDIYTHADDAECSKMKKKN